MKRRPPEDPPIPLAGRRPRLRAVPALAPTPSPPAPEYVPPGGAVDVALPLTSIAVLRARGDADLEALVGHLVSAIHARGGRAALLWSERTDALAPGIVTVAESAALFPDDLQHAARQAHRRRIAHLGAGGEARAVELLGEDLEGCTHAVLDGRLLSAVRPTLTVLVTGDGFGDDPPFIAAARPRCDTEVYAPSDAIALALLHALERRVGG
ncbi:MAG: hypothetical protein R3A48_22580 [Polyangiales bacterium]